MAIPVWVPGQVLTASDVNNWLAPNVATKTSDQSVTSSATLVNDTALVLNVAANAEYILQCYLDYEGASGAGFLKWAWVVPASCTMRYCAVVANTSGVTTLAASTQASVLVGNTQGAGFLEAAIMTGTVYTGSTSGTIQLQWAQNASNGTATIVHAQSFLSLQRVA